MGHTFANLMYHVVFSTKHRQPLIIPDLTPRLVEFVGGIIRKRSGKLLAMNGSEDHVHLLGIFPPKMAVSDQIRDIKSLSSGWIHDAFDNQKQFAWQEGYSAFSVSKSVAPRVVKYIENQREHHKNLTFEDELIALLEKHGIEYDPRYVFD
jgi:REP element-mobilizing transposase RayT